MEKIIDFISELAKLGLTPESYESSCKLIDEKLDGISDSDWVEIKDRYGIPLSSDTIRKSSTTIFGGKFRTEYEKSKLSTNDDDYFSKLRIERQEIQKEKQKLYDERTGLNKLLREQSRREELFEIVKRAIDNYQPIRFNYSPTPIVDGDSDLIIHLTDVHCCIDVDSPLNQFNIHILEDRLKKYLDEVLDIQKMYCSKNAYMILGGDMIHGLIHTNGRIESKEDIIQQIELVSDLVGNFVDQLRKEFNHVYVFTTPGNHSRSTASKEEARKGENFDLLVPYVLKKDFKRIDNVSIMDNTLDVNIATFCVRGHNVYASHGDKDSMANVVYNMTKLARKAQYPLPDMCYLGHRHTNGMATVDGVKVIQSGCVDGMDSYAIDNRFVGFPEQTVTVVTENKRVKALCDIQLD